MKTRYLVFSTLAAGVTLFLCGAISHSLTPDLAEKTQSMGLSLSRLMIIEFAVGFVLSLILLWTPVRTPLGAAGLFGLMGIAAGIEQLLSQWNWYGFSGIFATLKLFDLVIGWALAGLVIGALRRRFYPRFKYDEQIMMQWLGHRSSDKQFHPAP
jgi:hypothetical protein